MTPDEAYKDLMARLKYHDSARFRKILEYLMTPEQAQMMAALPGSVQEVAEKTGFDVDTVQKGLDNCFFKGVAVPKGDYITRDFFNFARTATNLHDRTQATIKLDYEKDREFYELWHDFVMNEYYIDTGKRKAVQPHPMSRIIPAYQAIKDIPDMQPYENYHALIEKQDLIAVVPCSCRIRTTSVGEHCTHTFEEERNNCVLFGRSAEYNIKRGSGVQISVEEALELGDKMEQDNLLHMWRNSKSMDGTTSCNCCRDCCMASVPMDLVGEPIGKTWAKSRYIAVVNEDKCIGCQDCIDRCQFDAIDMFKPEKTGGGKKSKKMKAQVDPEVCFGCGNCVLICEQEALSMKCVRLPEHIPDAIPLS